MFGPEYTFSKTIPFHCPACKAQEVEITDITFLDKRAPNMVEVYRIARGKGVSAKMAEAKQAAQAKPDASVIIAYRCKPSGHQFWGVTSMDSSGVKFHQAMCAKDSAPSAHSVSTTTSPATAATLSEISSEISKAVGMEVAIHVVTDSPELVWREFLERVKASYPLIYDWLAVARPECLGNGDPATNLLRIHYKAEHQTIAKAAALSENRDALQAILSELTNGNANRIEIYVEGNPIGT